MYSSVETYYTLRMDKIYGDEITEVELMILTGGNPDKPTLAKSAMSTMSLRTIAPVVKPISLYQSSSYLKVNIILDEKVNIKVLNATTDLPVYMRQYIPDTSGEMLINTSRWSGGYYNIIFTNASGEAIAQGTIYID
ncbi:hypothetical protein FACS1894179_01530 [Bacteroidia bacterium]|nr:hypothetical protein FACS1894169_03230 [Bacteroidia bacterium]GHV38318.1 hypothetical protein FACS1894179_01530 [Bacteroidia bacterium]